MTSSVAGLRPEPVVCYGYIASKAAILNVVRQAALDLAPHGVRINAICPGPVQGHAHRRRRHPRSRSRDRAAMGRQTIPLGRMAEPEEMKGLVLLLASPAGSFMTGASFVIDGGALIAAP